MFLFFIAVVWITDVASEDFLPDPVTEEGEYVQDALSRNLSLIMGIFFAAHIPLFVFPFLYRYKKKRKALFYPMNLKMEIIWTVIPFLAYMGLFSTGYYAWSNITSEKKDPLVIEITGEQFAWIARYPGYDNQLGRFNYEYIDTQNKVGIDLSDTASFDDFTSGRIHIPVDQDILFKIHSKDVIHSVFIPHFRLKMDATPGMPTSLSFRPTKTTRQMRQEKGIPSFNYSIYCAELCGRLHYAMKIDVIVEDLVDFQNWYRKQGSWLARHQGYLREVPPEYKEQAKKKIEELAPLEPVIDLDIFNVGGEEDTLLDIYE